MRIGIISMQRVINYGSFLQAYSLKKTIESLGHSCEFIDIKPGKNIIKAEKNELLRMKNLAKKFDKYFIKRLQHLYFIRKRRKDFTNKYFNWLGLSNENNWDKYYDVVVIGSDEVFNCTQRSTWGLSPNLLGGEINSGKIITYAASCGATTFNDIKKLGIQHIVTDYLQNIDSFSVRDKNTAEFVKKLTSKECFEHLDPVFIYNFSNEIKNNKIKKDYILIYAYDGRIHHPNEVNKIKKFAKQNRLKTISVGLYQSWCDRNISADPFELLGYVKNAKYIITDTFHGTVFSIKFNKPFAVFVRDSNENKLIDLLERFGLFSRRVYKASDLEIILNSKIDYSKVNHIIKTQQESAIEYLRTNINL